MAAVEDDSALEDMADSYRSCRTVHRVTKSPRVWGDALWTRLYK